MNNPSEIPATVHWIGVDPIQEKLDMWNSPETGMFTTPKGSPDEDVVIAYHAALARKPVAPACISETGFMPSRSEVEQLHRN